MQLHKRSSVAKLENDVHEIVIFEETVEADNVFMVDASMYVYFLRHLLLLIAFYEQLFRDDLAREYTIRFQIFYFVTSCESSL